MKPCRRNKSDVGRAGRIVIGNQATFALTRL